MKKLIFLTCSFLITSFTNIQAQDLIKIDNISIINDVANDVVVQVEFDNQQPNLLSHISETNVNQKAGFNAQLNAENTLLTLNFTQKFNERELETLLEYCGFKLNIANFNQLKNLLN